MLTFSRNKLVSIYRKNGHTLCARGILEDDIYGMEMEVTITMPEMRIRSIDGKWSRMENSECPRAVPFLKEALGFSLTDPDFTQKVQKTVGRKSCRHFANILLECCEAAKEAATLLNVEIERSKPDDSVSQTVPDQENRNIKETASPHAAGDRESDQRPHPGMESVREDWNTGGMVIDLHVHTSEASPCSSAPLEDLIAEAKRIGLDGICLTDHNHVWDPKTVSGLRKRHNFLILRGNEISTDQGDMLVFGFDVDIKGIIQLADLEKQVHESGGFIIAAHPFRGFLTFGIGHLGLTTEKAIQRPLFQYVDAVEVLNSKVSDKENRFSSQVAEGLNLPQTGGSDAHEVKEVGIYGTRFFDAITSEEAFLDALKNGRYQPVSFRKTLK
ncbi:MAG: PHP domain-containing protein [Deltaproteobacteria bacterium]